jgi:hypothetical protein
MPEAGLFIMRRMQRDHSSGSANRELIGRPNGDRVSIPGQTAGGYSGCLAGIWKHQLPASFVSNRAARVCASGLSAWAKVKPAPIRTNAAIPRRTQDRLGFIASVAFPFILNP